MKKLKISFKIFFWKVERYSKVWENPHQKAAIYDQDNEGRIFQLNGKKLSYNNYNDLYAALSITKSFPKNLGVAIIKHANPCGASINSNKIKCFNEALMSDPISAYGGILSCNFKINTNLAKKIKKIFLK